MTRDKIKILFFPLLLAGLYACFMSWDWNPVALPRRTGGLYFVAETLRWLLVEPMGFAGSVVFVFAFGLFVSGFLMLGKDEAKADDRLWGDPGGMAHAMAGQVAVPDPALRTFGKRPDAAQSFADPNALAQLKNAVEGDGFDWYFAHYGFEGRWREALKILRAGGNVEAASILTEADTLYDETETARAAAWEAYERMPESSRPSEADYDSQIHPQEKVRAYLGRMTELSRAFRVSFPS